MRAITVTPGPRDRRGGKVPDPDSRDDQLLVRGLAVGVCGTDREIAEGWYGTPPIDEEKLIVGQDGLGEVLDSPVGSGSARGELVVGIVRRPDPVPCPACAAGSWDMCRNDRFGERGIVRLNGYGSEQWRLHPRNPLVPPSFDRAPQTWNYRLSLDRGAADVAAKTSLPLPLAIRL
jgi:threonine dehydrogenase-like Zn-dependent dehydrogenase